MNPGHLYLITYTDLGHPQVHLCSPLQIPDNFIVDSESSNGRGWPEDEDEPEDQPGDYKMENAEELDETVSKKQPSTRVSLF